MTKEEARNYLLKWIEYATNPESHPFIDAPCSDEEILEAMTIGAKALSQHSLLSNLDEAAVQAHIKLEEEGSLSFLNIFKAGAEWQLNEDSEKHFFMQLKDIKDAWQELKRGNPEIESKPAVCFYKGAEWMAGQGYTMEGVARPDDCEVWVNLTGTDVKDGDKVIVQIRKK